LANSQTKWRTINSMWSGNFRKTLPVFNQVRKSREFCNYFYNSKGEEMWKEPWYFAKAEDTERIKRNRL
jgi:hypothetical protein